MRMFSGLMSRWTTPWSWAYCSASQICGTMARASCGRELARVQQPPQVHAVDKLHEEVVEGPSAALGRAGDPSSRQARGDGRLAEIVDRDDVRMAEHGHRPGFAGEPLGEGRVLADLRREDLQRHQPVEPLLAGLVDHAHAAPADQFQDLQVGKMGANSAGVGGTKSAPSAACRPPLPAVAVPNPPLSRQAGHSPRGELAASSAPHAGSGFLRS